MKLFFDARFIRTDHHDGVSLYSASLAKAVHKRDKEAVFVICHEKQKKLLPLGAKTVKINSPESIRELWSGRTIARYRPDVVFSPMQTLGRNKNYKLILTLQDMTYYKYNNPPKNHSVLVRIGWKMFYMTYAPQRLVLNRADIVSTVSETSRTEIIEAGLTKNEVIVATNAARKLNSYHDEPEQGTKPPRNLVFIGTGQVHKNIEALIKGMEYLPGRRLHLMSPMSRQTKIYHDRIRPDGAEIIYHDGFDSKKEAEVLADDALLVSASLAEGFGLPLVEAMEYGVPIVVSDMPIFREVAGEAAEYFDAKDPKAFAEAVKRLNSKKAREKKVLSGKKQAKLFSWDKSAGVLLAAARRLHGQR